MLSLIGPAFRYAEKNDFIIKNPMNVVDKPSKVRSETKYYNAEQLNILAKAAKGSYLETPVILAMVLGLRRSEIIGITWDNVDFDNRLIHIRQSVVAGDSSILPPGTYKVIGEVGGRRKREIILKTMLKTDSSVRSFTMNDALYNYLKELKAHQDVMPRETKAYIPHVDYTGAKVTSVTMKYFSDINAIIENLIVIGRKISRSQSKKRWDLKVPEDLQKQLHSEYNRLQELYDSIYNYNKKEDKLLEKALSLISQITEDSFIESEKDFMLTSESIPNSV